MSYERHDLSSIDETEDQSNDTNEKSAESLNRLPR